MDKKILIILTLLFFAFVPNVKAQITSDCSGNYMVINANARNNTNGSEGLYIQISKRGNLQVKHKNMYQFYYRNDLYDIDNSGANVNYAPDSGRDHSVVLGNVNQQESLYSGNFYAFGTYSLFTRVTENCSVSGNTANVVIVNKGTIGGKEYFLKTTYTYTKPNLFFQVKQEVTIPPNVTGPVRLVYGADTYYNEIDDGQGSTYGTANPDGTVSTKGFRVSVYETCAGGMSLEFVEGVAWSGYYSGYYDDISEQTNNNNSSSPARKMSLDNRIIQTTSNDKGFALAIDFGSNNTSSSVVKSSTYNITFDGRVPTPNYTTSITNDCPSTGVTKAQLDALVTNVSSSNLTWSTSSDGNTPFTNFPITTTTNLYPVVSAASSGCSKKVGVTPVAVTIQVCCSLESTLGPTVTSTTVGNNCPTQTANISSLATGSATSSSIMWSKDGTNFVDGTAVGVGVWRAYFKHNDTANFPNCNSNPSTNAVTVDIFSNCASGTINCGKTVMIPPTDGQNSSQYTLLVTVDNVTGVGCFSQVEVSGSGMSVANNIRRLCTNTTGTQQFSIPLDYDGTTPIGSFTFTIGGAGACSVDLSVTKKKSVLDIWSLDNCTPILLLGPKLK